ncbi:MAG: CRISPR-associated protein Csx15 [Anaerolineae bacterium]
MILLNFAHPLTAEQRAQIEALTDQAIERVVDIPSQIDPQQPLAPQIAAMVDEAGLSSAEWQTLPLLVNPPALNFSAVALLAELHGRCGYFPPCLRIRPVPGSVPPRYEVAEVFDLQAVRDQARQRR